MNFNPKYPNLLKPYKIGNTVFKNRMLASPSRPHFIQGPENYPTENIIMHYQNKARNGAALVTCNMENAMPTTDDRIPGFDYKNAAVQNYISQLCDAIHFYGSKASVFLVPFWTHGFDVSAGIAGEGPHGEPPGQMIDTGTLYKLADDYAEQAKIMQDCGFDMAYMHMAYRGMLISRFLSPLTNKRTDEFGGSFENRIRFPLLVCEKIKEKCGKDFLLEVAVSGVDPTDRGEQGVTIEDTISFAKAGVGKFDMIQIRAGEIDPNHPTGYNPEHIPYLDLAAKVKAANIEGMAVETIGGCFYPEDCEAAIRDGKVDFVSMARSWISNPDYGEKVYEGREKDLVPCLRCNKCHKAGPYSIWTSVCSVNPTWGLEHKIEKMPVPVKKIKRVAVVGGGAAGMRAALTLAERGHHVDLYEKTDKLGGQLIQAGTPSFKWTVKDYMDYLVYQVNRSEKIDVKLGVNATAELLAPEKYDDVIAAVGSEPVIPGIPGADGKNVVTAVDSYAAEPELAHEIVVIGGGDIGSETGLYLADKGHRVHLLEMTDVLAIESTRVHYYTMFMEYVNNNKNFDYTLNAKVTKIESDGVMYIDADGAEHKVPCGSVVLAVGSKAKQDEAMALFNPGERVFMAGDCIKAGDIQKCTRTAYAAAVQI